MLEATRCSLTCSRGQPGHGRHTGRGLLHQHADPGQLHPAQPGGVQRVGQQVHVVGVEGARLHPGLDRGGDPRETGGDAAAQPVHGALADLLQQLRAGAAHQSQRAVDERGVLQAVVDVGLGEPAQPLQRRAARVVGGGEALLELLEVAHQGEREQLLLAGEVPVDDRPVDPDRPRDVLDLRVPHPPRVEQGAGGVEDLLLTVPAPGGGRGAPAVLLRLDVPFGGHGPILDGCNHKLHRSYTP